MQSGGSHLSTVTLADRELSPRSAYDLVVRPDELVDLFTSLETQVLLFRYYRIAAGALAMVIIFKGVDTAGFYPPVKVIIHTLMFMVAPRAANAGGPCEPRGPLGLAIP
jgi:hypothetical protein